MNFVSSRNSFLPYRWLCTRNSNGDKRCYILSGTSFGLEDGINDRLTHPKYTHSDRITDLK
jgi:hypothetical protein